MASEDHSVVLLETNLDDLTGEEIGFLFEPLFEAGALDVYTTPIQMKKSRPAIKLSVLAPPDRTEPLERLLFKHTSTFGIRRQLLERTILDRTFIPVQTKFGSIRIKVGSRNGKRIKASPEFEDLSTAAKKYGVPLSQIREAALRAFES